LGAHAIDGIINLNKPQGRTSFQMVALVRKLSAVRKVGHSGTLDPDATGVLPVLLGRATRLASFITDLPKTYRAVVEFGSATTTYDSSGEVTESGDASSLTSDRIETALHSFRGPIEQIPPMYSAIKHQGRALYHLARAGEEIARKPRRVNIYRLEVIDWARPLLTIEVECSKGTYIRSLAHDLGQLVGCGAHLKELIRTRSGPFHIEHAVSLAELEEAFRSGDWRRFVYPPDHALSHLEAIAVDAAGEQEVRYGKPLAMEVQTATEGEYRRVHSTEGRFLGIVRFDAQAGLWRPKIVFA